MATELRCCHLEEFTELLEDAGFAVADFGIGLATMVHSGTDWIVSVDHEAGDWASENLRFWAWDQHLTREELVAQVELAVGKYCEAA